MFISIFYLAYIEIHVIHADSAVSILVYGYVHYTKALSYFKKKKRLPILVVSLVMADKESLTVFST